jgi:uncharacterized protein
MSVQRFEWDPSKERINVRKHGIGFELAASVFDDPNLLLEEDRVVDGEERIRAIGLAGGRFLLLVVHTVNDEESDETVIRIISARKTDKSERKRYGDSLARTR